MSADPFSRAGTPGLLGAHRDLLPGRGQDPALLAGVPVDPVPSGSHHGDVALMRHRRPARVSGPRSEPEPAATATHVCGPGPVAAAG